MTSADSNSPRTYLYRLITVRCKFKKKYFCLCKELLLSPDVPPADCYCLRTYLPRTITVRGHTCHGLLLSADVPATDYYCPQTYLQQTITAMCRREEYAQATGPLPAFFKISYYSQLTIKNVDSFSFYVF